MALDKIFIIPCNIRSGSLVHNALHGNVRLLGRINIPGSRWRRGGRTLVFNGDLCIHMRSFRGTRGIPRNGAPLAMPFSRCRFWVLGILSGTQATPHTRMMSMQLSRNRWNNCPSEGGRRELNSLLSNNHIGVGGSRVHQFPFRSPVIIFPIQVECLDILSSKVGASRWGFQVPSTKVHAMRR